MLYVTVLVVLSAMVGLDGSGVIYGAGEVDWMPQVCPLLCVSAACADSLL